MSSDDLTAFLEQAGGIDADLRALVAGVARSCAQISAAVRAAAIRGQLGAHGAQNVQGEIQQHLDVLANDILLSDHAATPGLAAMASEELETIEVANGGVGRYLLLFDPLDGSGNIAVNGSIGTIFSILSRDDDLGPVSEADFLQPGSRQVAAGYAIYGPQTSLLVTTGAGVAAFALDEARGRWVLTQRQVRIAAKALEFAINMSNHRHWEAPVRRYIDECLAGASGPRGEDFNMRWAGAMVADVHRVFCRGGLFMYPRDLRNPSRPGKLRLMYEANPMAFLVEQAGGAATTGDERLLDLTPQSLHQRVGVVMGSRAEVELILDYHLTMAQTPKGGLVGAN